MSAGPPPAHIYMGPGRFIPEGLVDPLDPIVEPEIPVESDPPVDVPPTSEEEGS